MTTAVGDRPIVESARPTRLGWTLATLAVLLISGSVVFSQAAQTGVELNQAVLFVTIVLVFALLGGLIASRHPKNAIGWLFLGTAVTEGVSWVVGTYADYWIKTGSGPESLGNAATWYTNLSWMPLVLVPSTFVPLLFPDGRLVSGRWRPVAWCAGIGIPSVMLASGLDPGRMSEYPQLMNPYGVQSRLLLPFSVVAVVLTAVGLAGSTVALVVRFRRARSQERQQIKWLACAAAAAAVIVPIMVITYDTMNETLATFIIMSSVLSLPVAAGVAILKYRLYDIDVVISRSLLVAGLAGFIAAAYIAIVVGVGSLLGGSSGEPNLVLSVVATTVVAVLFQPVRRRLQHVANRLVFGRRSTPYDVLSGFATRVGAGESSPESLVHLAELLAGGTGASPARVWLRVGSQLRSEATWPVDADVPASVEIDGDGGLTGLPQADLTVPVTEHGELLGVLTVAKPRGERVSEIDVDLVERLAAASGVVLRNLRLDAELAQRLDDLEASRRRLVSAQDDARRRIEADLAGGSRAELSLLRDRLTLLAADVDAQAAPKTALLLGQLVEATDGALETLAGLAAGVYPPRLAADGLVAALTEQADKAALPVEVRAEEVGRYEPEVEAAVYFAVLEGLQNVAKYANAEMARVRLTDESGRLSFEVTDDGVGFDTDSVSLGTGLQGIVDRLDTVEGSVTIVSELGAGTTLAGSVPVVESKHVDGAAHTLTGAVR